MGKDLSLYLQCNNVLLMFNFSIFRGYTGRFFLYKTYFFISVSQRLQAVLGFRHLSFFRSELVTGIEIF